MNWCGGACRAVQCLRAALAFDMPCVQSGKEHNDGLFFGNTGPNQEPDVLTQILQQVKRARQHMSKIAGVAQDAV